MRALPALALMLALSLAAAAAPAAAQTVLVPRSEIAFTTRQMGVPVDGRFTAWQAAVAFDPKSPQAARIGLTIDIASLRFGAPETDAEALKPAWFDRARFPQARFESTAVRAAGERRYELDGRLTIKGRTQPLTVVVTLAPAGALTAASGQFTLRRLAFALGEGEWADTAIVADEVQVRFRLLLEGLALP